MLKYEDRSGLAKFYGIPSAHAYEICLENCMYVIGKMKLASFSLFIDAFPLDPRCPLDNEMSLYTYTIYVKGVLGLGRKGLYKPKKTSNI